MKERKKNKVDPIREKIKNTSYISRTRNKPIIPNNSDDQRRLIARLPFIYIYPTFALIYKSRPPIQAHQDNFDRLTVRRPFNQASTGGHSLFKNGEKSGGAHTRQPRYRTCITRRISIIPGGDRYRTVQQPPAANCPRIYYRILDYESPTADL